MLGLKELQGAFKRHLLEADPAIAEHIVGSGALGEEARLGIYAYAYRARLEEALATDFGGLQGLLGEDAFHELCQAYIDARPSTHFSLRWFGAGLAELLAQAPAYADRPHLAEMAAFEWALTEVFDAANADCADASAAQAVPPQAWPTLRVALHPAVKLLRLEWNTPSLWRAARDATEEAPPLRQEPGGWLLWRQGLTTRYRSLDEDEAAALELVAGRGDFAELCECLEAWMPPDQVPMRAASLLKTWLADSMVHRLETD